MLFQNGLNTILQVAAQSKYHSSFRHAFWLPDGLALLDARSTGVDIPNASNLAESYRDLIAQGRLENKFFSYSVWSPDDNSIVSSSNPTPTLTATLMPKD